MSTSKTHDAEIKVGCSESVIDAPLFTELYGYGPFIARRNRGVHDPLYCRCASFSDGRTRILIISNDLVTMDPERAWEVRGKIASSGQIPAENIMLCGSHTHAGPTISQGIGWGEVDPVFVSNWQDTACRTALAAIADETPAALACGAAALTGKLGYNRVWPDGPTDPEIRWAAFRAADGVVKLLLHNHAMHGVVFGRSMKQVSADWPGAVNGALIERQYAQHVVFLQGAAGDINSGPPCCLSLADGEKELARIADIYLESLKAGMSVGAGVAAVPVRALLKKVKLPSDPASPSELRETAAKLRTRELPDADNRVDYQANRLEEMALMAERGADLSVTTDLQVLRIGELLIHAVGGEPFNELGREILEHSPGRQAMLASIANDNLRYIPPPRVFRAHPDVFSRQRDLGYYEVHFAGLGRCRAKYRPEIGPFLVEHYFKMGADIYEGEEDKILP